MISFEGRRIYLACGITDGRKSINGLSAMVRYSFQKEPTEESIFVFCNRDRDRLKILEYDGNGYWLYLKRLDECRFQWPDDDVNKTMTLTNEELYHLLSVPGLTKKLKHRGRKKQVV
ncbi:transposase [Clostridia bacterium]|nr:transposase [Clostridia bacterium]